MVDHGTPESFEFTERRAKIARTDAARTPHGRRSWRSGHDMPTVDSRRMTRSTTRSIRGVFFDVGDTLVHLTESMPTVLAREAAAAGVTIEHERLTSVEMMTRARLAERATTRRPFSFPPGESRRFWTSIYFDVLREHLAAASAIEVSERVYAHFSSPHAYGVYRDVVPSLRQLRALGIRLGIISNWESWIGQLIAHHDLARWFDWVIASGDVEVEKPNTRIFDIALERSGFVLDEVLYVGDSPATDVAGARHAGWRAILLARDSEILDPPGAPGTILSLSELPALVSAVANRTPAPSGGTVLGN